MVKMGWLLLLEYSGEGRLSHNRETTLTNVRERAKNKETGRGAVTLYFVVISSQD